MYEADSVCCADVWTETQLPRGAAASVAGVAWRCEEDGVT